METLFPVYTFFPAFLSIELVFTVKRTPRWLNFREGILLGMNVFVPGSC